MSVHPPMRHTHRHVHPDGRGGEHDHVHTHNGDAEHGTHAHPEEVEALFTAALFEQAAQDRASLPELAGRPPRRPRGAWAGGTPVTDADRDRVWAMYERVKASRRPQRQGVYASLRAPSGDGAAMMRWVLGYGD